MMIPACWRSEKHLNLSGSKADGTQVSHLGEFGGEVKPAPQGVHAAAPAVEA
jgi:hypothetical protein